MKRPLVHAAVAIRTREGAERAVSALATELGTGAVFDVDEGAARALSGAPVLLAVASSGPGGPDALAGALASFEEASLETWSRASDAGAALWAGFARAVAAAREASSEPVAIVGAMLHGDTAHVTACGGGGVFLLRRGLLHDITAAASEANAQSEHLRHALHKHDRLVLTCDALARSVHAGDVRRIVMASSALDAACERLLEAASFGAAAALAAEVDGDLTRATANEPLGCETPIPTSGLESHREES